MMFDKTITLKSTDGSVQLQIKAGTEGVKSLLLETPSPDGTAPAQWRPVTEQQLMDYIAEAIKKS